MNIYIDFAKGKIEKVTPAPIYFGDNNVDKITLYFKNIADGVEWYPTLSALCSDNNPIYPRLFDTDGTGTKTIDGVNYTYYEFTLSNSNGWNLTPGRTLFYVWVNYPNTNGNKCVGTFGCTILGTSGYYKVDNLVVNPELREYLETSFEQHYNEVDERFDSLEEEFNDEYTEEVNTQRNLINNLIGGEPRYVNTSSNILALTSNQGVAVGTDTGHWYYWDGTQYVDGGVYNSNPQESITNSSNIDVLNEATFGEEIDITTQATHITNFLYDYIDDENINIVGCEILKVSIKKGYKYYATTSVIGRDEYFPLITYFDSNGNKISYEYMNVSDVLTSITHQELYIPDNASYFYVNARNTTPYVYERKSIPLENDKIINTITSLQDISPNLIYQGRLYYYPDRALSFVTNGVVFKYNVNHNIGYYVTTSLTAQSTGFPLVSYFDSNDNFISYEYMNTAGSTTSLTDQLLNVPTNASYFYVNGRNATPVVKTIQINNSQNKEIKILFVGNSLTQDGIAYLPYLLKTYYPNVDFKIYMWYIGGATLAQHYQRFINNQACEIFSIANNTAAWSNGTITMSSLLSLYKFDIVCLQEYFNYKESYTESDLVDFNNCVDYITSNYTGGNPLKFISLFHAPKRDNATNIYNLTKSGNELILQKTICEDMLANGIAVYNALSTDLDTLGDQQHLSPDGTHTQEGLPCLLQTYTTLLWILNKYDINTSIYGFDFKMTTEIYNTLNVPGANLGSGVIEGTDSQNLLAQEVAIKSYKKGTKIVNDNLSD